MNWIKAQDQVFENCANGKQTPDDAVPGSPDWLQKDRAYQKTAAEFYSLDCDAAKTHFAEIAADSESPWRETADYLVARTVLRQASLTKDKMKAADCYGEAEIHLQRFVSSSGKFAASAERLMGLIKFRNHPKERVGELAKALSFNGGNENFRQDVIDYNRLLDKFASEVLTAEEKRKEEAKPKVVNGVEANYAGSANAAVNAMAVAAKTASNSMANAANTYRAPMKGDRRGDEDLELNFYVNDSSWTFYVKPDATDDEAIAAAEKVIGSPLTEETKKRVRELHQSGYAGRFSANKQAEYEGGYYGEEKLTPSLLPGFLRDDDLTGWLYTYQMQGAEAYLYSLSKFKADGSELWLMTALSKADKSSTDLTRLVEAANNANRTSPGYTTIAYHTARILIEQGKSADARKLIDEMLNTGDQLPISSRNSFLRLRLKFGETLEDFLNLSLRKPYAFDFDGETGNFDTFIAEQKAEYNPEYTKDGREAFDAEVEGRYKTEKEWQGRMMFDTDTIEVFNQHFPTSMLLVVQLRG